MPYIAFPSFLHIILPYHNSPIVLRYHAITYKTQDNAFHPSFLCLYVTIAYFPNNTTILFHTVSLTSLNFITYLSLPFLILHYVFIIILSLGYEKFKMILITMLCLNLYDSMLVFTMTSITS